jgi:aspartyl-tRNA(Asn)/glutamyl-tRNA(Gln) amidotransferase subunit C
MTKINKEQIAKIADLARIELTMEESLKYADDLSVIISWVESLNELDTDSVEPMMAIESAIEMREDISSEEDKSEDILKNAPEKKLNFFVVPKFVG